MKRKYIVVSAIGLAVIAAGVALIAFLMKNKGGDTFEYAKVEEAIELVSEVKGKKYQNLSIPENIEIGDIGQLYTVTADTQTANCDMYDMAKKLGSIIYPEGNFEIIEEEEGHIKAVAGSSVVYFYDTSTFTCESTIIVEPEIYPENGKTYVVGEDDLSDEIMLNGESCSIKEIADYAQDYARENILPLLVNNSDVQVDSVHVFKIDNQGNNWVYVLLRHYIDGCPVSTVGWPNDEPSLRPWRLVFTIDAKDHICQMSNECYATITNKTKVKKIITLDSALSHLENVLAPESGYTVSDISLEYCAKLESFDTEFEYRPMWCLTVARSNPSTQAELDCRQVICIDAQTGDVICYDYVRGMLFEKEA